MNLTTHYPAFLSHFYGLEGRLDQLPYQEHQNKIRRQSPGWSASMCSALSRLGIETTEIYSNAAPLQSCWAKENNLPNDVAPRQIIFRQIEKFRPNVLFVEDLQEFDGPFLSELKQIPGIRLMLGLHCAPYTKDLLSRFRPLDAIITCSPGMKPDFDSAGLRSFVIYHAFAPETLRTLKLSMDKRFDLLFAGSIYSGPGLHNQRRNLLEELIKKEINLTLLASAGPKAPFKNFARWGLSKLNQGLKIPGRLGQVKGHKFPLFRDTLRPYIKPPVWGEAMMEATRASKVVLNIHVDAAGDFAANMRLFEVTGLGSCLLTDRKKNLSNLFDVGKEIVDYGSPAECSEKARWLLDHPIEREAIAAAGQLRTLKDHTYEARAAELDLLIRSLL